MSDFPWSSYPEGSLTAQVAERLGVSGERFTNWRWQMSHQITTAAQAAQVLGRPLSGDEEQAFSRVSELFRVGITPYYAALMAHPEVALQAMPQLQEDKAQSRGVMDPLAELDHSPVREVVHVYPDRVAFCVAMLCPVYCRYCYRKRRDEEVGLHFNREIIARGLEYIAKTPGIRDVLVTGGDPLVAADESIERVLSGLREIPHVEIVRIGTRTPVTLPYRITPELARILAKYHPVWLNTHFNCAEELTPEACRALAILADHGIPLGNQAVLLKGVNDSPARMLDLCRKLIRNRVRPYYVFHAHRVAGTDHLRVPVDRGLEIMKSLRGNISGYGIPAYIVDTPSGKVPLTHSHVLGRDGEDLLLEDVRGEIHREKHAFFP